MIDEKTIELLVERLIRRIEQANTFFLIKMGSSIKQIRKLKPSEAQRLIQILKYGGNYEEIIEELSKYTNLNIQDLDKIFSSYARKDQEFYKDFYKYRNIPFVPFDENVVLQSQKDTILNLAKNEMYNFTRSNVLGYTIRDLDGNVQFLGLKETYNRVLDEALLNVSQGKQNFDSAMTQIMKDIGGSGLKYLDYESGRSIRLDSAVDMHLKGRLRELHNENQKIIGKEFDADGVEITVHENPAPDHQDAQGRQFRLNEFESLQKYGIAKDVNGETIDMHLQLKKGGFATTHRPISEMNCYHYFYSIIVGVSKPAYSKKQLQEIKDRNNKGFEFDGKHYTMYQGTQLQRQLERKIREQKDIQIFAKASGNKELVLDAQTKITQLTRKYKELSNASNLPPKAKRLKVRGYRRTKVLSTTQIPTIKNISEKLEINNIKLDNSLFDKDMDKGLVDRTLNQVNNLVIKYPQLKNYIKNNGLLIEAKEDYYAGSVNTVGDRMTLNKNLYENKEKFISKIKEGQDDNWSSKIAEKDYDIYTATHETGHILEDAIIQKRIKDRENVDLYELSYANEYYAKRYKRQEDTDLFNEIFMPVSEKTGISWKELEEKYISDYGKSEQWYEWFAELFTKMELGDEDIMTKRLKEFLEGELWKK